MTRPLAPDLLKRSFSDKVYQEVLSDDGKVYLSLLETAIQSMAVNQLDEIIDLYDSINREIHRLKALEFNLPVPNLPTASSLRTHVVPLYTNNPIIVIPHNLGTEDYTVHVQGSYVTDPPGTTRQLLIPTDVTVSKLYDPVPLTFTSVVVFVPGVYVGGVYVSSSYTPIVNWTQNTSYNLGDLVVHKGVLYMCLVAHTSADTGAPNYDADFYQDRKQHYWWKISQMIKIENPSGHNIDNVLFVYHHNYLKGRRHVSYWRKELNSWKFTRKGVELFIRYVLDDNADIRITEKVTVTKLFKFYNYDFVSAQDNSADIGILKFTPPLPATSTYDGRPLSLDDPLILSPVTVCNPIDIYIRADVQPDIKRFVEDTVRNYLIPLPTWLSSQVTFHWDDYTQDWI